jgi:hypothetical protein
MFMNLRSKRRAIAFGLCALLCGAAAAVAGEANPAYTSWASQKPGTSVTMKNATEMMGQKTEMEMVSTLKEVTADKAVVEVKTSMTMMGNKTDMPAQTQDIPAKAPDGQPTDPIEAAKKAGAEVKDLGEETVSIAGGSYKCKVMETKMDQQGMKVASKIWTSTDMPGMLVKLESKTEGQMASTSVMEVTAVDKK